MTLTLGTIRDHDPCEPGWRTLTKTLGTIDPTTELSIGDVVLSNGLADALWCLGCLEPRQRIAAIMPSVRRASALTADQRVHDCIAAIDRWLAGDDTVYLRKAARAAWEASAARAARAAGEAGVASAARAAGEARAALGPDERDRQIADLLAMFPPIRMKEKAS